MSSNNPFDRLLTSLKVGSNDYKYYSFAALKDQRVQQLPYSIRILLESAIRNTDNYSIYEADVEKILDWVKTSKESVEVPFKPARVLLQDFTGVPAVVDLAAMRDAVIAQGVSGSKINPLVPVDLVIDHSVQVDYARTNDALQKNMDLEMHRNKERFQFLKWGSKSFENFLIVPPGSGIVHQVNLEYLARCVMNANGLLYPDSVVGTDSHTTMIDGLGIAGWGVGGIEAESVMLGQPISMVLPEVIGFKLTGKLQSHVTATDLVLTVTEQLRKKGVVDKFVEFYGPGLAELSLADRATIANMAPEYGATMGFFPVDQQTIKYLVQTGRDDAKVQMIESYYKANGFYYDANAPDATYTDLLHLDLSSIVPSVAGPKRPHDRVSVSDLNNDFTTGLTAPVSFKGFGLKQQDLSKTSKFTYNGKQYELKHGSVVIAAITSCTNTSNPNVLIGAGLLAKNAVERGLTTAEYIKTSLAPGSGVVTKYLESSGLLPYLSELGFTVAGYGCTTCIGNSGEIPAEVGEAIDAQEMVVSAVLSGNRNFEGRVHPQTRANYLASPPLVVAYALAGTVQIDFDKSPIGKDKSGKDVYLKELWPTSQQISELVNAHVKATMFQQVYKEITNGSDQWRALSVNQSESYEWDDKSTYIHHPPFFQNITKQLPKIEPITNAYCLLNLGDSITTDHISPAGDIALNSPAAKFLESRGVTKKEFNSYGSRRGNDEIMARGTFANIRIINKLVSKPGARTIHIPSKQELAIFDASAEYKKAGQSTIVLGGKDYGCGSSRDWAAKGPYLLGVRAVIAVSFERIHRSNLVGMGILPLVFQEGENADILGLTGHEQFSIDVQPDQLQVGQKFTVKVTGGKINEFTALSRLNTPVEIDYYKNGGILHFVLRKIISQQ